MDHLDMDNRDSTVRESGGASVSLRIDNLVHTYDLPAVTDRAISARFAYVE